ncbi:MAG: ribosome-associated translation inhibitor RaiA [Actinomycetota bacterium]
MDLQLKGRGLRLTDQHRRAVDRKRERLERLEPRAVRLEVEIIAEKNPRLDGTKRAEASLVIPRKTFRAHADGPDVQTALSRAESKLERQIRDHHTKRRARMSRTANRLESAGNTRSTPE